MTEVYKEEHPLLCDDLSEDERYSSQHHRRRPISYRNRARYHVKGAAAMFKRWPDHWFSFVTYWWIGIVMICLTTFILYNSLYVFTIIPLINSKPTKPMVPIRELRNESGKAFSKPEVFMHIFHLPNEEVDLNKHLPHIEDTIRMYPKFEYSMIIVMNDTLSTEIKKLNAEEVNEMALNMLWSNDVVRKTDKSKKVGNVNLKYITLSEYMDNSPLVKFWRHLSKEVVEFLMRSLSIWDKGGIAFNPSILVPGTFKDTYKQKIFDILQNYHSSNVVQTPKTEKHLNIRNKFKKKVNNIRDIIEALEHDENSTTYTEQTLDEAENKEFNVHTNKIREIRSIKQMDRSDNIHLLSTTDKGIALSRLVHEDEKTEIINTSSKPDNLHKYKYNISNTLNMLPSFLEYLFHGKDYNHKLEGTPVVQLDVTTADDMNKIKSNIVSNDIHNEIIYPDKVPTEGFKNVITSITSTNRTRKKAPAYSSLHTKEVYLTYNKNRLTIDLKGNIVATEIPCHAFLGTLYSNAIHHPRPTTLTNFLISELSTFCKGLLTTCAGVDLILL